jgi:hypothetical protein
MGFVVEIREEDASISWVDAVPTLIGVAAVLGIAWWGERTYRRWLKENHPLADTRARLEGVKTGYRRRRANLTEVAQLIGDILDEIGLAMKKGSAL